MPCRDSLLVHGPQGSGKTAICNRLLEQLLVEGYQCCVIGADLGGPYPCAARMSRCSAMRTRCRGSPTS